MMRTEKDSGDQPFTTLDSYLSAFLVMQGIHPVLVRQGSKVAFRFSKDDALSRALDAYHGGAPVEAFMFARTIKGLKGQIFALKMNNEERDETDKNKESRKTTQER